MSVAKLNVEIGATIRGLTQGLKQAEREMRQAGQRMADLGNSLSLAFTLPLAGIGISAIKAAGDIEALRLAMRATFEGAGRSIQEADAELENLRKSAMAPGLEFDQAVRASVRLQNVGFSAEKARKVIEQLANTVATTGGTAEDLGEVVNQFSQMIGKGKIFQDDLKILTGRMPKLAQIMKETFGTTTAEGLNRLGIDARTFVDTVTEKMAEMPRVSGGIANAIVNAGSAIKFSLAKVGETINRVFNVTGGMEGFATWITGLADSFAGLSEGTQRAVLGIGVFALALGPAIRGTGLLVQGVMAANNAWKSFIITTQRWLFISSNPEAKTGLIAWWRGLNTVMKANIIAITVAVVLALAAAFALLSKDMSASAQAARAVQEVHKKAAESIVDEKVKTDLLIRTLNDENATREQKKNALAELKAISPEYFGKLTEENGLINGLTEAYSQYINELMRSARVAAARGKLAEIETQLLDTTEAADPSVWQTLGNAVLSVGNASSLYARQAQTMVDNSAKVRTSLIAQRDAMTKLIAENELAGPVVKKTGDNLGGLGAPTGEAKKKVDALKEAMSDWSNVMNHGVAMGLETFNDKADKAQDIINRLIDAGFDPMHESIVRIQNDLMKLGGLDKPLQSLTPIASTTGPAAPLVSESEVKKRPDLPENFGVLNSEMTTFISLAEQVSQVITSMNNGPLASMNVIFEKIATQTGFLGDAALGAFSSLAAAAAEGSLSFAELGKAALEGAAQVAKALIVQIALQAALKSIEKGGILGAVAAIGIAAALVGGLSALVKSVKVPALAEGGITTGPQLAMVGDNPGGREAIIPLDRLNKMFSGPDSGGGELTARITDDGLLFVLERAQRRSKRTRGF